MKSESLLLTTLTPVAAILISLGFGALLMGFIGVNPLTAYLALLKGAFGSINGIAETLVKATPLLLVGLGIAFAFRARIWNIGGEGQLLLGALGATLAGLFLGDLPRWILLPIVVLAGFVFGGTWGAIVGFLKARYGTNEIIVTIMMNYIAIYGVSFMNHGPLREAIGIFPQTDLIGEGAWLGRLLIPTRVHAGIFLAIMLALISQVVFQRTSLGYRIMAVGQNPDASNYAGIGVRSTMIWVMILSGGLAGIAGMSEISGIHHRLMDDISGGYGFTGIVVALLGRLQPLGVVVAAILFGALNVGADSMERTMGLPSPLAFILQALVVLFVLGGDMVTRYVLRERLRRLHVERKN
jgi:simple sugar transport system permease protein